MKTYTIVDSTSASVIKAPSKKKLFVEIKESTPMYRNQSDKQFMEGYSVRRQIMGLSPLDTTSIEKFIDSMISNKLIVEGDKSSAINFAKKMKRMAKKEALEFIDLPMEKRQKARQMIKTRASKTLREKKKIGSVDSVISLSKLKDLQLDLLEKIPSRSVRDAQYKRRKKIQDFIQKNSPLVDAEDLRMGQTVWIFSGAPQYFLSRAKVTSTSSSKSPNFITLYLTEDKEYEKWIDQDSWENRMRDFDNVYTPALRIGEGRYYKSVKKDKKIPLG